MGAKIEGKLNKFSFKDLTTFRVGGKIKFYKEVRNPKELVAAVSFAKTKNLPIFILGGGSDILASDSDFDGVVIKYTGNKSKVKSQKSKVFLTGEAGMIWDDLVNYAVTNALQGIECLSGIPGTVGAAPIQNIGAYGQELKDTFAKLTAYDIEKEKFVEFDKKKCRFSYRESIFKDKKYWQKHLITGVTLKLNKNAKPQVKYDSLKNYLNEKGIKDPSLQEVRKAILFLRKKRLEDPKVSPNAGSFFKNPIVKKEVFEKLKKDYPDIPFFAQGEGKYKLFAAWLIEKAGWKGKKYKNAAVSAKNALTLINLSGKAKAIEVKELSEKIQKDVWQKFGVELEREVQLINFDKTAILGYGIEGQDAEKYFQTSGAEITILDRKFDKNYLENLDRFDVIVRSPGVYRYLPEIVAAEKKGVKVTSAIKLFFDECPAKIIGVTGTKGKGTTTTLIYQIMKKAGFDVYLAGNIGKPYLELLPKLSKNSFVILEMSSFQLIDMELSPHIAVVLNITSDHLDWHKNQKEYVEAKKNIVRYQTASDYAVINKEYATPRSFAKGTEARVIFFSKKSLAKKYKTKLLLRGEHNLENISAAVSVAKILKIKDSIVLSVLRSFKGLEHRLELVKNVSGVTFYNDSFATGPQPTIAAIRSFEEPATFILGGSEKGLDYTEMGQEISRRKNVGAVVIIGQVGPKIKKSLIAANFSGKVLDLDSQPMEKIVNVAFENTPKGGVVVLSPAAASFDMFENYKDRGNQFNEAVLALKNG